MDYQFLRIKTNGSSDDNKDAWSEVSCSILDQNDFSDFHASLEKFYRSRENIQETRNIFLHHRDRSRFHISGLLPKLWDLLALKYMIKYGLSPIRPLVVSFVLFLIGGFVFSHPNIITDEMNLRERLKQFFTFYQNSSKMEIIEEKTGNYEYNSFWYSLDVFLPFVDLWAANYWKPNNDQRMARNYVGILHFGMGTDSDIYCHHKRIVED